MNENMFERKPTKQSEQTFKPEKTIAKTVTTRRFGFHVIGRFYMVFYLALIIYLGVMFIVDVRFQSVFVILTIGYFLIVLLNVLQARQTEVLMTDRRFIYKDLMTGKSKDIPFETVLNVLPVSPWVGKLFKYGYVDLVLETQVNVERIHGVVDAHAFSDKAMQALIAHAKATNKGPRA